MKSLVPVGRKADFELRHNMRVKTYRDGSQEVLVCDRPIWGFAGYEDSRERTERAPREKGVTDDPDGSIERAARRARAQLKDLALSTDFRYFVTLTLSADRTDRYDMKEITRHLNHWLDNAVRRKGLTYVLVPERHKDGAVHFHGFFNSALPAEDSGTVIPPAGGKPRKPRSKAQRQAWLDEGGHIVYNLPAWGWGYSTAIELYGDYNRAVGYVCKYIGKDTGEKIGGRWFYSGGDLHRPEIAYGDCGTDIFLSPPEDSYAFRVEKAGLNFNLQTFPPRVAD